MLTVCYISNLSLSHPPPHVERERDVARLWTSAISVKIKFCLQRQMFLLLRQSETK
jgi:hypothetical protein